MHRSREEYEHGGENIALMDDVLSPIVGPHPCIKASKERDYLVIADAIE